MAKKKKKLPPGGISLGSSSKTTWRQTPTSRAVDEREDKKLMKKYADAHVPRKPGKKNKQGWYVAKYSEGEMRKIDESEKKRERILKKRRRPAPVGAVAKTERKTTYGKTDAKGRRKVSKEAKFSGSGGMMPDDMHKKLYGNWLKTQKK